MSLFTIVSEDDDLLVIDKPAGLVCHPTKAGELSSLVGRVRLYLGAGASPQLINRLDRETSGVTLVAKTAGAAREIRRLWETRQVTKEYLALVHGEVAGDSGLVDAPLGKDTGSQVAIRDCVRPDGMPAQTGYQVERRFTARPSDLAALAGASAGPEPHVDDLPQPFTLLRIRLYTGRKHQIRIHLAHLGHPIVGDKIYGADETLYLKLVEGRLEEDDRRRLIVPYHALHACRVAFEWQGRPREFLAAPGPLYFGVSARTAGV